MKTLIIEDHALMRGALKQICADLDLDLDPIEADTGDAALLLQRSERPGVIILDMNLPGVSGLALLNKLLAADPAARILIFSMHGDPSYADRALKAGAKGYVSKNASPEELRTAMKRVVRGLTYVEAEIAQQLVAGSVATNELTDRDLEILRLLGEGRSFNEIAGALKIGYKTVANSATIIKTKLGVARTADLIRFSIEMRSPKGS